MPPSLPFEQKLIAAWPADRWQDVGVLVAVSGGPDSVALLRAMHRLSRLAAGRLAAAHFNHHLRGPAALADQEFVAHLCRTLEMECVIGEANGLAAATGGEGLEATARAARYEFLTHSAEKLGARYVATGHTTDDQAETILHHILRGTGLRGLAGMPRVRALSPAVTLVRPLLDLTRAEVLDYLADLGQPYQQDETNCDRSLARNRIRHELVPLLARDYSPAIAESLVRLGALAGDAQQVIDALGESLMASSLVECEPGRLALDCRRLRASDRHLVREALIAGWRRQGWPEQSMGWAQWNLLADLVLADGSNGAATHIFPGAITAQRKGEQLVLASSPKSNAAAGDRC